MLHKPGFRVTDETLDTLQEEARKLAMKLFEEELKNTVIINVGRLETDSESASLILQRDFEDSKALTAYGASFSMRTDYGAEILSIAHSPVADCYVLSINRG